MGLTKPTRSPGPHRPELTRGGFLRYLAQEARRFARALWEDPDPGFALTEREPVTELGPAPAMRVVAGKPVYVWLEAGQPVARQGLCPRDGSPVYWRGNAADSTGSFVCPVCGTLRAEELPVLRLRDRRVQRGRPV